MIANGTAAPLSSRTDGRSAATTTSQSFSFAGRWPTRLTAARPLTLPSSERTSRRPATLDPSTTRATRRSSRAASGARGSTTRAVLKITSAAVALEDERVVLGDDLRSRETEALEPQLEAHDPDRAPAPTNGRGARDHPLAAAGPDIGSALSDVTAAQPQRSAEGRLAAFVTREPRGRNAVAALEPRQLDTRGVEDS